MLLTERGINMLNEKEYHRVAAYCRVSTDKLDQVNSLESQQKFFAEEVKKKTLWELYDIYVDEGITGTNTDNRDSFNRMIDDAKKGLFDIILTKEVSRFARNTVDSLVYKRELEKYGVAIYFLTDNIFTLDKDAEFRLTIMASLAQDESRKTSERVKWGQRRRMEQGVVFGRDMLGYDVRNGKLYINEEGAETVRLIYHKYLYEGKGTNIIAKELREAGIKTSTYMKDWSYTVIRRVLTNEKYCGDLIQQKTFTPNYLDHKKVTNEGQLEKVIIRNHHEPIISKEMFEAVQREMARRRSLIKTEKSFGNRYALSGKIRCGKCNSAYTRHKKKMKSGRDNITWSCSENGKYGAEKILPNGDKQGCSNKLINDRDIKTILQYIMKDVLSDKTELINTVIKTVGEIIQSDCSEDNIVYYENAIEKNKQKKERLLDLCLSGDLEADEYRIANDRIKAELLNLQEKLKNEKAHKSVIEDKENMLKEIREYIINLSTGEEWSEMFYRNIVDKIVVNEGRKLDIHLKLIPENFMCKLLCGTSEIKVHHSKTDTCYTAVPISVSVAFNSGNGIVNLCDKYLKEAASSPSGPPYSKR